MRSADDTSPTFAEAWDLWLAYRCASARPLRASTLADYRSIHAKHLGPAFDGLSLNALDGARIARFTIDATAADISRKRLANVLVPLRACLRWHHRMGSLDRDPSPWFDPPAAAADERRILTPAQIEALLAELPERHRAMIAFAAYTGVRAGELRALTWTDIDLDTRTARIDKTYYRDRLQRSTKTGHDRTVPIPPHVATLLADHRERVPHEPGALLFPGSNGRPLELDNFRARTFRPAVQRAGLPAGTRIHDLRHTSASLYLQSGATVREVMEIHGWRQMQTALRYLHAQDTLGTAADRLSAMRERETGGARSATSGGRPVSHPPAHGYPPS